jgi:hypothetical protein
VVDGTFPKSILSKKYFQLKETIQSLIKVAQTIENIPKRPTDLVARYGGEEFALILPNTNLNGVLVVAQQIQQAIADLKIPHRQSKISQYVTLSMGVASLIPKQDLKFEKEREKDNSVLSLNECLRLFFFKILSVKSNQFQSGRDFSYSSLLSIIPYNISTREINQRGNSKIKFFDASIKETCAHTHTHSNSLSNTLSFPLFTSLSL